MTLWLDAHLSPQLAPWLEESFSVEARSFKYLGLDQADDHDVFARAREAGAIIVSKDSDFIDLVKRLGTPPQLLLVMCGNTSNESMRKILSRTLERALELLRSGEPIVEIADPAS